MKIKRDLVIASVSQLAYKGLGFAVLALLARQLSKDDYGKLMFSLSLCLVTATVTDLGSSQELLRSVASRPSRARRRVTVVIPARISLLAAYLVLINLWVALTKPEVWPVAAAISIYAVSKETYHTFSALFLGLRRIRDTVVAFGSSLLILTGGIALGVAFDQSLAWMAGSYVMSGVALIAISWMLARNHIGPIPFRCRIRRLPHIFGRSLVLFALSVMGLVHFGLATLLLGYLVPFAEVARYEAAAKLLEASQSLIRPMSLILLPVCVEFASRAEWSRLRDVVHKMLVGAAAIGGAVVLGATVLGGSIVKIVYTSSYNESAEILRVLSYATPGLLLTVVGCLAATAMHREKRALVAIASGVVANAGLCLWLIPTHGGLGAAWAMVTTQSFVGIWLAHEITRVVQVGEKENPIRPPRFDDSIEVFNE